MSKWQLDTQGKAHDALNTLVNSYGRHVLNDPHIVSNLVSNLLPDLPRERSLLVTAAEAGLAAEITQHVEEQHINPQRALELAARALSERYAISPSDSVWVAAQYAQALGYALPRPSKPPVWPSQAASPPQSPTLKARPGGSPISPMPIAPPPTPITPPTHGHPQRSWTGILSIFLAFLSGIAAILSVSSSLGVTALAVVAATAVGASVLTVFAGKRLK